MTGGMENGPFAVVGEVVPAVEDDERGVVGSGGERGGGDQHGGEPMAVLPAADKRGRAGGGRFLV